MKKVVLEENKPVEMSICYCLNVKNKEGILLARMFFNGRVLPKETMARIKESVVDICKNASEGN